MNSETQESIMEHVGAENWEMVAAQFAGKTEQEIKAELDEMFTQDDNGQLAADIYNEL